MSTLRINILDPQNMVIRCKNCLDKKAVKPSKKEMAFLYHMTCDDHKVCMDFKMLFATNSHC